MDFKYLSGWVRVERCALPLLSPLYDSWLMQTNTFAPISHDKGVIPGKCKCPCQKLTLISEDPGGRGENSAIRVFVVHLSMIAMLCLFLVFGLCVGVIHLYDSAWHFQQKNNLFWARLYTSVRWSDARSFVTQVEESPAMQANRELQDGAWRCVSTKQLRTSPKRDTSSHLCTWEPRLAWGFSSKSVCMWFFNLKNSSFKIIFMIDWLERGECHHCHRHSTPCWPFIGLYNFGRLPDILLLEIACPVA